MDTLDSLLKWATGHGVEMNGVRPNGIPGRGFGMVATRHMKKGEVVMIIPTEAIRSRATIQKATAAKLSADMTLHGLLAADLLLHPPEAATWAALVPSREDFETSTPFFWPNMLHELLPQEAKKLLRNQQSKFRRDWAHFHKGFPKSLERDYLYSWFLVGTRSFYNETDETLKYEWHDRLALLPMADMFNHASAGCEVTFWTSSYQITTDRAYRGGEEVYLSYGGHSNDFLLAEYGFVLQDNATDQVCLDSALLPKLTAAQQMSLSKKDRLGDFMLRVGSPPSDRIWTALRVLTGVAPKWSDWTSGREDASKTLAAAKAMVPGLLAEYRGEIEEHCRKIAALRETSNAAMQCDVLLQRWRQIDELVQSLTS